jgi:hypothetical protein
MRYTGRCACDAVHYEATEAPTVVSVCHCRDCQRSAGAPLVAWADFREAAFRVTKGSPRTINSSGAAMRTFCADCGTGLYYTNAEVLPGIVAVQAATLDEPESLPPTLQVQTAERQAWVSRLESLEAFERYPS